jgi:hypothetical protein
MASTSVMAHALRAALLIVAGSALIFGPVVMGLGTAPLVSGVIVGALTVALGVAGTEPGTRGSLPLSTQAVYDRGLTLGLLLSAAIFAVAGLYEAMALFAGAGFAALIMTSVTRYSASTAT